MKAKIETFETITLTCIEKPNRELKSERHNSKIRRNAPKHAKCNFLSPPICLLLSLHPNKTESHKEDEVKSEDGEVIGLRNVGNNPAVRGVEARMLAMASCVSL